MISKKLYDYLEMGDYNNSIKEINGDYSMKERLSLKVV